MMTLISLEKVEFGRVAIPTTSELYLRALHADFHQFCTKAGLTQTFDKKQFNHEYNFPAENWTIDSVSKNVVKMISLQICFCFSAICYSKHAKVSC